MPTTPRRAHTAAVVLLVIVGALACVPAMAHAATAPRLIVGFTPDATPTEQQLELRRAGVPAGRAAAARKRGVPALRAMVVDVAPGRLAAVRAGLLARPDVAYVEVDHVAHAFDLQAAAETGLAPGWRPNDTFRSQQWSLDTLGAERAWGFARGTGVKIAILDTGVDYIHPDLEGRVDLGPDLVDGDPDPMDVQGHGTHVAGIAAAGADDGFGIVGMAPGARILAVRVLDAEGAGNYSVVARGIVHAADAGAKIINLSLGGPEESHLLRQAIDYAAARGAVVTCASGNESAKAVSYPAKYESCVAVGASDPDDGHASFSNTGAGIDLTAPGVQVLSSTMGGSHDAWEGTSMAAPYVAGAAALLSSQGLGRQAVLAALNGTATDLGAPGPDTTFGVGRIDVGAAVEGASRTPRAATDATVPTVSGIQLGAPVRTVKTTWKQGWKVSGRTPFRRVGTTQARGQHTWRQVVQRGTVRQQHTFRARGGIIYRSTVTSVKSRVPTRTTTATIPVIVAAADDVAVDRISVEIDGVTAGVDWSAADGWSVRVPCTKGTHTVQAWAFDAADNRGGSSQRAALAC